MTTQQLQVNNLQDTGATILNYFSGHIATQVIRIGHHVNIFQHLTNCPDGIHITDLAIVLDLDVDYLTVWVEAAYAFHLIQLSENNIISLDPAVAELLTDVTSPAYIGGMGKVLTQPEVFGNFAKRMKSGDRIWWEDTSTDWIAAVTETCRPMYTRFLRGAIDRVPGLRDILQRPAKVLELASGGGQGSVDLLSHFPLIMVDGVDGDEYSIQIATQLVDQAGLSHQINFIHSTFEDFVRADTYDIAFINASIHECRDLAKVIDNIHFSLKPGGIFVISDFPFPEHRNDYHKLPNRLMLGVNFFESQIGDRLLPNSLYTRQLQLAGFTEVNDFTLTGTHSIIYGYKPH